MLFIVTSRLLSFFPPHRKPQKHILWDQTISHLFVVFSYTDFLVLSVRFYMIYQVAYCVHWMQHHYPSRKLVWTPWTSSSFTSVLTTTFKSQFQVFCTVSTFPSFRWLTSFETTCSNNSVFPVVLIVYCLHYFFSSADNSLPVSPFSSRVKSKDHHSGLSFLHSFRSLSPLHFLPVNTPTLFKPNFLTTRCLYLVSWTWTRNIHTHPLELWWLISLYNFSSQVESYRISFVN